MIVFLALQLCYGQALASAALLIAIPATPLAVSFQVYMPTTRFRLSITGEPLLPRSGRSRDVISKTGVPSLEIAILLTVPIVTIFSVECAP